MRLLRFGTSIFILFMVGAETLSQAPQPEPYAFLRKELAFSSFDLATLERGQAVVKLPKTPETREVAAFAIIRLDISGDFFVESLRDIVNFKKSENVLQIGKFSSPPRLEDLAGLTLDPADIESLKQCRVKKCDLKMSATSIERLRKEVDWSAPNYEKRVTQLVRAMLLERVQGYLVGGNDALGNYEDKSYTLGIADELRSLLKPAPYMYGYVPEFQRGLEEFPLAPAKNGARFEDFFYWSKEAFGLKPVISLTHVTIYRNSHGNRSDVIVASKGIYATHYFEASLGLTAYVESDASEPLRSYLIYANRSRADALRGLFAGLKRSLMGGRLRDGARKNMEGVKQKLESEYRNYTTP